MSRRIPFPVRFLILPLVLAGCAGRGEPPSGPGFERGGIPDLRGARVFALPLQIISNTHADVGREIDYALRSRTTEGGWIHPEELREVLRANPGTQIGVDALPVNIFLSREVQRVGDPLFGDLYRLGVLTNTTYAVLPIEARSRVSHEGLEVVEIVAAMLEVRSGRVLWFGIVGGSAGPPGDLSSAATAAEALARRIIR
jgi:hypothetical protein